VLLKDPSSRAVSCEDAVHNRKRFLLFGSMSQDILFDCTLTLLQHVSSAYKDWWSKVTVSDLRTNV